MTQETMDGPMDPEGFLSIAREVFAPLYPFYAGQFLDWSGLRRGLCLDLGCGGGDLGLAVAGQSDFTVVLMDRSPVMLAASARLARERGLQGRALPLAGDACALPLADGCADLIVSRGSLMFWPDLPRAFAEVRRVLSPGGTACLGGGLGTAEMRQDICRKMAGRDPRWASGSPPPPRPGTSPRNHEKALREAGVTRYRIVREDTGHWVVIGG
ncbi:class I SAM-dependent methyltransferase [Solidesulfovibrio sp.]|uniref:class I SAM-dependent methyltransferase n=1 Tax=Solidesulfovibrio sp. TaxID=2910990 RepID=UPI0026080D4E|nr:class I SAM-dependent methyltransferase [Solidesulfovibrio sp.]